jgi:phosphatidylserine/phosphatidylglycerophosphate/cardiolipin synthase-like enzyme
MRSQAAGDGISVRAVAGTHVVLFGFDVPDDRVAGLMGFALKRTDEQTGKAFKVNDVDAKPNHSSLRNPFQEFVWGDYTLRPGWKYRYEVSAMYGTPGSLKRGAKVEIEVETESESDGIHAVFSNRGVAASQAYARKFKNKPPDEVGPEAFQWLSRGLAEAMSEFIGRARGAKFKLRAAVYEFIWAPVLDAFAAAAASGADVQIVFDAVDNATKKNPVPYPRDDNLKAIGDGGLKNVIQRTMPKIAHNKFVVLVEDDQPIEVWTGSTNVTEGALYGQCNIGHIVRDPAVAKRYLDYWTELSGNPSRAATRAYDVQATPVPREPPAGITEIFSPRRGLGPLNWYAKLMDAEGNTSVFLTAAFGVSPELTQVFEEKKDYLRYLLLDKRNGKVRTIARNPSNEVTAGGYIDEDGGVPWSNWLAEKPTGLNPNVQYVHTKFMLINPLGDDPLVISGSANFSKPSTTDNDENMLVIRGDTRVADIYLGEFMRLFTHFRFRGKTRTPNHALAPGPDNPTPAAPGKLYLSEDDSWAGRFYVKNSLREKERLLLRAT